MANSRHSKTYSDRQTLAFIVILFFVCGLLLALAAYGLQTPQRNAKQFDQSKQMLIAAKRLNHQGVFQILQEDGTVQQARFDAEKNVLIPSDHKVLATQEEIKKIASLQIRPLLTDKTGKLYSLEEKQITLETYLEENKKTGYAHLPNKLVYAILPNAPPSTTQTPAADIAKDPHQVAAFVIPVSGFGLWAPIYGYIALASNGSTVIGTTWYEHGETPGLGANIAEAWWQALFYGKSLFQQSGTSPPDLKTADIGIIVVKGKVQDVYGEGPKAKSAVDGISGATLTGNGVTEAYRNSLSPYRSLFIQLGSK